MQYKVFSEVLKYTTLNKAKNGEVQVSFANNLSKIKYYKSYQLFVFEVNFYPCTGLGCLINFHLIYDLENKNVYPFGAFRVFNSELHRFKDISAPIYLAKSYEGNLHEGEFTYEYTFFKIEEKKSSFLIYNDKKVNAIINYKDYSPIEIQINNFVF